MLIWLIIWLAAVSLGTGSPLIWMIIVHAGVLVIQVRNARRKVQQWHHSVAVRAQIKGKKHSQGGPSSTNWMNCIMSSLWINYRQIASHFFLYEIWPFLKARDEKGENVLGFLDFQVSTRRTVLKSTSILVVE